MTYADMFSKVKGLFMESDVSDISEHLAFQLFFHKLYKRIISLSPKPITTVKFHGRITWIVIIYMI